MSVRKLTLLVAALSSCTAAHAAEPASRVVHVSGQGTVEVAPDQVVIQMTVTTVDDDLFRVRENSDKDARTILNDAKKYGTDDKGFRVSRMQLSLQYNEQLRRQIYNLERDIAVELNDLTKLDRLLLDLLREPNLKVKNITFSTSKSREYEFEALKRAVADAREKAQHLAELTGLKLGKARDIRVNGESQTPFVTSVIPAVGSTQQKPRQGDVAGNQSRAQEPLDAGSKSPAGRGFYLVALEASGERGEQHDEGKSDGKPFAVGKMNVTADVEIDYDLGE